MDGLDFGTLKEGFDASMGSAGFYLQIILAVLLLLGIIIFVWWLNTFNVVCVVHEQRVGGIKTYTQKAKVYYNKRKDGTNVVQRIKIFSQKKEAWYPSFSKELFMPKMANNSEGAMFEAEKNKKGQAKPTVKLGGLEFGENYNMSLINDYFDNLFNTGKKGQLTIRMYKEGDEYTIIPWRDDFIKEYLRVSKPVRQQWSNVMLREANELFKDPQNFFDKYGPNIMFGTTLIACVIILVMLFNKFEHLEALAGAVNNHAKALTEYVAYMKELNVQPLAG